MNLTQIKADSQCLIRAINIHTLSKTNSKFIYTFNYMYMSVSTLGFLYMSIGALRGQEELDSLVLELQAVVSFLIQSAEKRTWVLFKSSACSQLLSQPSTPPKKFLNIVSNCLFVTGVKFLKEFSKTLKTPLCKII